MKSEPLTLSKDDLDHLEEYLLAPDSRDDDTHARFVSNSTVRALIGMARSSLGRPEPARNEASGETK